MVQPLLTSQAPTCRPGRAPAARLAHPREEHLPPLTVVAGTTKGEAANCNYHETEYVGGVTAASFRFE
jgi:hypothetical protein